MTPSVFTRGQGLPYGSFSGGGGGVTDSDYVTNEGEEEGKDRIYQLLL